MWQVGHLPVNAERSKTDKFGFEDKSWLGAINHTAVPDFSWNRFIEQYTAAREPRYYVSTNMPTRLAEDVELPSIVPCLKDRHEWTMLWMGAGGENSLIHNDQFDNLYAIVAGTKKVILFDPMESPYLYEDKYLHAKGKVSAIDFDAPNYTKHPLQRHVTYREVTVEAGDMLFIPLYWWHQVYSIGRSIGVTHWFDMWKKSSLVGSGRGVGTDQNMRIFNTFMRQVGSPCAENGPPVRMQLSEWQGCKESPDENHCTQVTARHDFCHRSGAKVSNRHKILADYLLNLWSNHASETTQEMLQSSLGREYSRADVNAALDLMAPCKTDKMGGSAKTEIIEYVGDMLYFKNVVFKKAVVDAAARNDESLRELLKDFSKEEVLRLFVENLDDLSLESPDDTKLKEVLRRTHD